MFRRFLFAILTFAFLLLFASALRADEIAEIQKTIADAYAKMDEAYLKGDSQAFFSAYSSKYSGNVTKPYVSRDGSKGTTTERFTFAQAKAEFDQETSRQDSKIVSVKTTVSVVVQGGSAIAYSRRNVVRSQTDPQTHKAVFLSENTSATDTWRKIGGVWTLAFNISTTHSQPATANARPAVSHPPVIYHFHVIAQTGKEFGGLTFKNFAVKDGFYVVLNNRGQAAFLADTNKGLAVCRYTPGADSQLDKKEIIAHVGEVQNNGQIAALSYPTIDSQGHVAYIVQYQGSKANGVAVDKRLLYSVADKLKAGEQATEPYYDGQDRLILPIVTRSEGSPGLTASPSSALVDGKRDAAYAARLKALYPQILRCFYNDKGQVLIGGLLTNGVALPTGQELMDSSHVAAVNQNGNIFVDSRSQFFIMDYDALAKQPAKQIYGTWVAGAYRVFSEDNDPSHPESYPDLYKLLRLDNHKDHLLIGTLNDEGIASTMHLARHSRGYGGAINDHLQIAFPVRYYPNYEVGSSTPQKSEQCIILGTPSSLPGG